jgi:hypothetical protein
LKTTFSLHLILESLNQSDLGLVLLLLFNLSLDFLFKELLITGKLFLKDASLKLGGLLDLLLLKELNVLLLQIFIEAALFDLCLLARVLLIKLLVELLLDEALSLTVSHEGLLLLFVVKKGVELLNSSPFIVFIEL